MIALLQTFAGLTIFYTMVHLESKLTLKKGNQSWGSINKTFTRISTGYQNLKNSNLTVQKVYELLNKYYGKKLPSKMCHIDARQHVTKSIFLGHIT